VFKKDSIFLSSDSFLPETFSAVGQLCSQFRGTALKRKEQSGPETSFQINLTQMDVEFYFNEISPRINKSHLREKLTKYS
jgi:hypothetical protein